MLIFSQINFTISFYINLKLSKNQYLRLYLSTNGATGGHNTSISKFTKQIL